MAVLLYESGRPGPTGHRASFEADFWSFGSGSGLNKFRSEIRLQTPYKIGSHERLFDISNIYHVESGDEHGNYPKKKVWLRSLSKNITYILITII